MSPCQVDQQAEEDGWFSWEVSHKFVGKLTLANYQDLLLKPIYFQNG